MLFVPKINFTEIVNKQRYDICRASTQVFNEICCKLYILFTPNLQKYCKLNLGELCMYMYLFSGIGVGVGMKRKKEIAPHML